MISEKLNLVVLMLPINIIIEFMIWIHRIGKIIKLSMFQLILLSMDTVMPIWQQLTALTIG